LGDIMRRGLSFSCGEDTLAATLDDATGSCGLFIVSGGNEIRSGAHRGMAKLAADIAAKGFPVFRFDRRGIGDSSGENGEFLSSAQDIEAALAAFRNACPHVTRIIGFGNCDAASALLLHSPAGVSGLVLGNIWVIEKIDDLPPPAAIKARYLDRMKDPKAWVGLFSGAINLRKLASGLFRIAMPRSPTTLPHQVAAGLEGYDGHVSILLCNKDTTAIAFANEWSKPNFQKARAKTNITVTQIESASHSFASDSDYAILSASLVAQLSA
jgi:exosortase A-associated hydrolase 1